MVWLASGTGGGGRGGLAADADAAADGAADVVVDAADTTSEGVVAIAESPARMHPGPTIIARNRDFITSPGRPRAPFSRLRTNGTFFPSYRRFSQ